MIAQRWILPAAVECFELTKRMFRCDSQPLLLSYPKNYRLVVARFTFIEMGAAATAPDSNCHCRMVNNSQIQPTTHWKVLSQR